MKNQCITTRTKDCEKCDGKLHKECVYCVAPDLSSFKEGESR